MAAYDFTKLMVDLESYGLRTVLLPFLLVFAIVYAILEKIKIFDKKGVNVVIAFVMGFFVATNTVVVEIIGRSLPNVSVVLIAILCIILVIGIFGFRLDLTQSHAGGLIAILAFVVVGYIFARSANWGVPGLPPPFNILDDPGVRPIIIVGAIFFILIWYITKEDTGTGVGPALGNVLDQFRRMLQKP